MKVLVTGGAGLIGRALTRRLSSLGHKIAIFDNFTLSQENLVRNNNAVSLIRGDIRDYDALKQAMKECDTVFHLAGPSSVIMYEEAPVESVSVTVAGFLNVMEAVRQSDVERVIYASVGAIYEGQKLPHSENMTLPNPVDLKVLSKRACEDMARLYSARYGISTVGMRPFSVYGLDEGTKGRYANVTSLFLWFMLKGERPIVWGEGEQSRDFIFVDDVAEAFELASRRKYENEIFNVGTGIETSFNEVVSAINKELRTTLEPVYVPVQLPVYAQRIAADTSKAMNQLGFKAKVPLVEGVRRQIASYSRDYVVAPGPDHD
jgi:nucleoside-diphosphate-sugar epimerase